MKIPITGFQINYLRIVPVFVLFMIIMFVVMDKIIFAVIALIVFIISTLLNIFIVEAWIDEKAIYLRRWVKYKRYTFDKLDKVGNLSQSITDITILTNSGSKRWFLLLNPPSFRLSNWPNSFDTAYIYDLLITYKIDYLKRIGKY